ncbi:MAG TPA: glycosyltransferase family 87 protein [Vicinamibacterales bacterium]|nr:glycosyltransferase family 87 protein [Vicinamibacterales bacterium]
MPIQRDVRSLRATWLLVGLGVLALGYLSLGFGALGFDLGRSYPIDLRLRWTESRLLLQHVNPQTAGHPDPELSEAHQVMQRLGGSYPPWAYATGLALTPPLPWTTTRWYAFILNALAIGVLGWWCHDHLRPAGGTWSWLAVAAAFAIFPVAICISYGQYSVIVAACVALAERLLSRPAPGAQVMAGVLIGLACVKPQLAGLFVLALVVERRWIAVASWAGYLALASGIAAWLAGSNPVTMLATSTREASAFAFLSHNILTHWAIAVLPFQAATLVLALAGVAATAVLLVRNRQQPRLVRWSVCAVIAMFWAYRKHYDVPLMILPVTALLLSAVEVPSLKRSLAFLALGATLWLPIRDAQWDWPALQIADLAIWVTILAVLLSSAKDGPRVQRGPVQRSQGPGQRPR